MWNYKSINLHYIIIKETLIWSKEFFLLLKWLWFFHDFFMIFLSGQSFSCFVILLSNWDACIKVYFLYTKIQTKCSSGSRIKIITPNICKMLKSGILYVFNSTPKWNCSRLDVGVIGEYANKLNAKINMPVLAMICQHVHVNHFCVALLVLVHLMLPS